MGDVVADGVGLPPVQHLALFHGQHDGGGGVHHLVGVQNVAPVLALVDVHAGVPHAGELPDGAPDLLREGFQLRHPPVVLGGQRAHPLKVPTEGGLVLGILLLEQLGLQPRCLGLGHQDGARPLHAEVRDPLLSQPADHRAGLLVVGPVDEDGIGPVVIEQDHRGHGHHQDDRQQNPYFFRNLSKGCLNLVKIALQLLLVQVPSTPLSAYVLL